MERLIKATAVIVFAVVLVGFGATPGWAQGTTELSGRIVDPSGAVLPGVSVTITNELTAATRSTVSNETGMYRFSGLPPGTYTMEVVLSGFATSRFERLELLVAQPARQDVELSLGSITESVTVTGESPLLNVMDSSLGNTINEQAINELPIEAQNVVELLSLQPGAVFIPAADLGANEVDPRFGAVSGARVDQQNVTLDGVDVNDPELQTAYTSAVRITQEALQEFRVSTSNYGAEYGRSSGPQVSMVTKSGGNQYRGSGYWFGRRTATSTNEYFLELSQLESGDESVPPTLDKDIFGGSIGGPIIKDRAFFYFNYERLQESSEQPVYRDIPSDSFRDGILMYECADPGLCPGGTVQGLTGSHSVPAGYYGLTPAEIATLDPLGIGPSLPAMDYFRQYPSSNDPGDDGVNVVGFRFASPIEDRFNTYVGRLDIGLTETGNQNLFVRFNGQDDTINDVAQFPGTDPIRQTLYTNFGLAVGHDWVLSDNVMNTFRYGYTKIDQATVGQITDNYTYFRFFDNYEAITFNSSRRTPLHNFVEQLTWHKGEHTFKAGANLRFTRIPSSREDGAYLSAGANGSWVSGVGRTYMPGSGQCQAGEFCTAYPAVADTFAASYGDPWLMMIGVLSQANLNANYDKDGTQFPVGAPIERTYATDEYEFFVQDTWQISPELTLTAGLRYMLYSPPYEANGLQVAPTISMGEWFAQREQMGEDGVPSYESPLITFDLAGPANGKKGYYDWDKNNFAPAVSMAWSPGDGDLVVRGGYYKVFDRIGMGLAMNFDDGNAYGMATGISSPWGDAYESMPGARFVASNVMPTTMPAAPAGGFPATPPIRAGIITSSIDDTLTTPYAHVVNVAVAKQLSPTFMIEGAYVGRFGRDQLIRRDIAMPLNLTDPESGQDYFSAVQDLINSAHAAGLNANSSAEEFSVLGNIAYWENLFPGAAQEGRTATQNMAHTFMLFEPDYITALWVTDQICWPYSCSRFGEFAYWAEQYDSLGSIGTIGRSNYNAMQLTVRKRMSDGIQFDVNYTLSKAEDMGSGAERGGAFGNFNAGGYSGFIVNSWDPETNYGTADYDVRHQVNANWIYELPFQNDGVLHEILDDWSVAGLVRWTSGFPFNVFNCRSCWVTNWNLQGNAMLVEPGVLPPTGTNLTGVDGRPSPYTDPEGALSYFRRALPGEVGERNLLRGEGYFTLDLSFSKLWDLGPGRLRFRWDIFNVTNHYGFDVRGLTMFPDRPAFGRYNNAFSYCDGLATRCMQFGLRYEF